MSKPGWMDESLEEEWIDQNEQDMSIYHDNDAPVHGLHTLRAPQEVIPRGDEDDQEGSGSSATAISPQTGGTFLIREDVQHEPVTPARRLPGNGKLNPFAKSFFSPLALERMFEPPSPPVPKAKPARISSTLVQSHLPPEIPSHQGYQHGATADNSDVNDGMPDEIIASDIPNLVTFDGRKPSAGYTFTFRAPIGGSRPPPPSVDPRLRLFQTYDTYTKDHLSALVDTIDVKSAAGSPSEDGYSRSSKRIRLSPPESEYPSRSHQSVFSARSSVSPRMSRPNSRRDYVGESRSLMQQIKNNRSFSIGTTLTSDVAGLSLVEEDEEEYEEQGADAL
jgi:protein NUD1